MGAQAIPNKGFIMGLLSMKNIFTSDVESVSGRPDEGFGGEVRPCHHLVEGLVNIDPPQLSWIQRSESRAPSAAQDHGVISVELCLYRIREMAQH